MENKTIRLKTCYGCKIKNKIKKRQRVDCNG
jgi:hypothetical protein